MIGVVRRNSDRTLFIADGQLVAKSSGNIDQRGSQKNDWVQGPIGDNIYTDAAKYKGGDKKDPANYDSPADIERENYPDN